MALKITVKIPEDWSDDLPRMAGKEIDIHKFATSPTACLLLKVIEQQANDGYHGGYTLNPSNEALTSKQGNDVNILVAIIARHHRDVPSIQKRKGRKK